MSTKFLIVIGVALVLIAGGLYYFWYGDSSVFGERNDTQNGEEQGSVSPPPSPAPAGGTTKKVRVISPNGGEAWQRGKQYNIRWDTTLSASTEVKVQLIKTTSVIVDPYAVKPSSITGYEVFVPANFPQGIPKEGTYNYLVPQSLPTGTYQLLVWAGSKCSVTLPKSRCDFDLSDALFTVK